ncbi:unnamed protein product [Caenorhabditis nigoni]
MPKIWSPLMSSDALIYPQIYPDARVIARFSNAKDMVPPCLLMPWYIPIYPDARVIARFSNAKDMVPTHVF